MINDWDNGTCDRCGRGSEVIESQCGEDTCSETHKPQACRGDFC